MKIALVGPITGLPARNRALFEATTRKLERLGHVVASPTHLTCFTKPGVPWEDCLAETIPPVCYGEAVVVLDDWQTSRGSILEVAIALLLKKPIHRLVNDRLVRVHPDLGLSLCRLVEVFAPGQIEHAWEVDP